MSRDATTTNPEPTMIEMTEPTLLLSHETKLGTWTIETDRSVLVAWRYDRPGCVYALGNDLFPGYQAWHTEPYAALRAVGEHHTGLPDWDRSGEKVSDYAGDWVRHIDKRIQRQMLEAYLKARPGESVRSIVDYFELRHFYYLERHAIEKQFREMIKSGDLKKLPSMRLAPAEMSRLAAFAKRYGCAVG